MVGQQEELGRGGAGVFPNRRCRVSTELGRDNESSNLLKCGRLQELDQQWVVML